MKTKRGPLNKVEKFYILNNKDLGIKQLAKDLGRSETQVKKAIPKQKKQTEVIQNEEVTEPASMVDKLIGKHERHGQVVATVMTEQASMLSDDTRSERVNLGKRIKNAIHKPKG